MKRFWFWRKNRAIELLHRVGIKDHKDIMRSFPYELTEGECPESDDCHRTGESAAPALIADEPTNAMEPTTRGRRSFAC